MNPKDNNKAIHADNQQAWSAKAQHERRVGLLDLIRGKLRPLLDEKADAPYLLWWDQGRVELWASNAFFAGEANDIAFGNTSPKTDRSPDRCHRIEVNEITDTIEDTAPNNRVPLLV